jgi:hypothetical protein
MRPETNDDKVRLIQALTDAKAAQQASKATAKPRPTPQASSGQSEQAKARKEKLAQMRKLYGELCAGHWY